MKQRILGGKGKLRDRENLETQGIQALSPLNQNVFSF